MPLTQQEKIKREQVAREILSAVIMSEINIVIHHTERDPKLAKPVFHEIVAGIAFDIAETFVLTAKVKLGEVL